MSEEFHDAQNDVLMSLSEGSSALAQDTPEHASDGAATDGEWLTVSQVAAQTGINERTLRRALKVPKNAALTRQETRRTRTGTRRATVLAPELVQRLVEERGANADISGDTPAQHSAESGDNTGKDGRTPAPNAVEHGAQIVVPASEFEALKNEVAQLRGALVGGALQAIDARLQRLDDLPSSEQTAQIVAQAVEQGIAAAVEKSDGASRDDVANAVESATNHIIVKMNETNAALLAKIEELEAAQHATPKRGFLGLFRRG